LPYAKITYGDSGKYADSKGRFLIDKLNSESVLVDYLGYKEYYFNLSESNFDTLKMKREPIALDEVVLGGKTKKVHLEFLKSSKFLPFFPLGLNNELIVNLIPLKNNANAIVKTVYFKLDNDKKNKSIEGVLRINVYDSNQNKIFISSPIRIANGFDGLLKIDLPKNQIVFDSKGLSFGMEVIDIKVEENEQERKIDPFIAVALAKKTTKEYSSTTFLEYPLSTKKEKIPINDLLQKLMPEKEYKRNLSIAMDLIIQDN
tara:strand:- start:12412 stop:13188 length:777 start_codon:yes stop_codon:yes gene_type:complete